MSIWDIYLDLDALEARRAYNKRHKNKLQTKGGGRKGKKGNKGNKGQKSKLPLIILVSVLAVILILLILFISMLLTGWSSNPLTRAINRSKAVGMFEDYIFQETGSVVNLNKVKKELSSEEEKGYYNDIVEVFSADPGITALWFEYLRMDEWDFAMAKEDIRLEIESSDTDMLLALCSKHGYPEFKGEYGYLLDDEEPVEEAEEAEEPEETEEPLPVVTPLSDNVIEEPETATISRNGPDDVDEEPVEDLFEDYTDETGEEEYTEEVTDFTEDTGEEWTEEEYYEETDNEEYAEEEMTME